MLNFEINFESECDESGTYERDDDCVVNKCESDESDMMHHLLHCSVINY